jgi:DNA-binding transcriptional LysR family regulator
MFPGVELRFYRHAVVLAQELHFTYAAAKLHVSQPTLTEQIHKLEEQLGVQLFTRARGTKPVSLTAAEQMMAMCQPIPDSFLEDTFASYEWSEVCRRKSRRS